MKKKKTDPLYLIPSSGNKIAHQATFDIPDRINGIQLTVEWIQPPGLVCDLDVSVYLYDERARLIERLNADNPASIDGSFTLLADVEEEGQKEFVRASLHAVDKGTYAALLYLDGGSRNFQHVQGIHVNFDEFVSSVAESTFGMPSSADVDTKAFEICHMLGKTRNNCQGALLLLLYKTFYSDKGDYRWTVKNILESVYCNNLREKDEKCREIIISGHIAALDKYKPHLFPDVHAVCAKLSSKALPALKNKFAGPGLPLKQFVETIFKQLIAVCPQLNEQSEADYLVAMLYDMFGQIDLNGDGSVDWEEFTSFTVSTGVAESNELISAPQAGNDLDDYTIEYREDGIFNCALHSAIKSVRHVPSLHRILITPMNSSRILFHDERGNRIGTLHPSQVESSIVAPLAGRAKYNRRVKAEDDAKINLQVYDCIYLTGPNLYAYSASDHSIGICREKRVLEGQKPTYVVHNVIYHHLLHDKLCWSEKNSILCSIASNNDIYGWNIDTGSSIFNIARHTDVVTDLVACDLRDSFVSCSLDKRIVVWSMKTRRVRGVLVGHSTGVLCISVERDVLLSTGFECDAITWDLNTRDKSLILRGHRVPILCGKLMCAEGATNDEMRAVTADESGELRLWNVFVNEKSAEGSSYAPCLQTFFMDDGKPPENKFHFLVFPFDKRDARGCFSNIQAISNKVIQFTAEKNSRSFEPPTCAAFNESTGCIVVAVSNNLLKYDAASGKYLTTFKHVASTELTALCFDDPRGRKLYVGSNGGDIVLLNFSSGVKLFSDSIHRKEVTCLHSEPGMETPGGETVNLIVSGALDGQLKALVEEDGELVVHHTAESPFGFHNLNCGVGQIKGLSALKLIVVASIGRAWTLWNVSTFKRLFLFDEESSVLDIEIILDRCQLEDKRHKDLMQGICDEDDSSERRHRPGVISESDHVITIAVALMSGITIYSISVLNNLAVRTFQLFYEKAGCVTSLSSLYCAETNMVNYSSGRSSEIKISDFLVVGYDDGSLAVFELDEIRRDCLELFREHSDTVYLDRSHSGLNDSPGGSDGSVSPLRSLSVPSSPKRKKSVAFITSVDGGAIDHSRTAANSPRSSPMKPSVKPLAEYTVAGLADSKFKSTAIHWKGHSDSVAIVLPLHKDGCFVSVSLDGFIRIWNVDKECLGEKTLTNLTDEMKKRALLTGRNAVWKFIQERIAVTDRHREVARRLLRLELGLDQLPPPPRLARRANKVNDLELEMLTDGVFLNRMQSSVLSPDQKKELHEKAVLRSELLCDLSTRDAHLFSAEGSYNEYMHKKSGTVAILANLSPFRSPAITEGDESESISSVVESESGAVSVLTSNSVRKRRKKPRELWEPIGEACGGTGIRGLGPVAFSEASLSEAHHDNMIDGEGHTILRKIAQNKVAASVYDRIVPDLYLRNPQLSTAVEVPPLKNVQESEMVFGNQKNYYKNATGLYEGRHRSIQNKMRTRHHIAVNRIQRRVKNIGTMMHIEPKCVLDEVAVPTITEQSPRPSALIHLSPVKANPGNSLTPQAANLEIGIEKLDLNSTSEIMVHDIPELTGRATTSSGLKRRSDQPPADSNRADGFQLPDVGNVTMDSFDFASEVDFPKLRSHENKSEPNGTQVSSDLLLEKGALYTSASSMDEGDRLDEDIASVTSIDTKLDTKRISNLIRKVNAACDEKAIPEWERLANEKQMLKKLRKKQRHSIEGSNDFKLISIEKKLAHAIRQLCRIVLGSQIPGMDVETAAIAPPKPLTHRFLLPFYSLDAVNKFIAIFNKVDVDFTGDLDADEWNCFFTKLNGGSMSPQEAGVIFAKMDKNEDGSISIKELIPYVFGNATKEQQRAILYHCQKEIVCKKDVSKGRSILTSEDLDMLFNFYDIEAVGFVSVSIIKDRIRGMELPRDAEKLILRPVAELQDDEMLNSGEFHRVFDSCLTKSIAVSKALVSRGTDS